MVEAAYDPEYGARASQRCIETQISIPLGDWLLNKSPPSGSQLSLGLDAETLRIRGDDAS